MMVGHKYLYKIILYYMTDLKTIVYSYPLSIPPLFAQKIFRPRLLSPIPAAFYLLFFVPNNQKMRHKTNALTHPR